MQLQAVSLSLQKKYLRRRHKLYKALSFFQTSLKDINKQSQQEQHCESSQAQFQKNIHMSIQKQHQILCNFMQELYAHNQNSSFDGYLFCSFVMENIQNHKNIWLKYFQIYFEFLQSFVIIRSGQLIAYVIFFLFQLFYRICRKNSEFFNNVWKYIEKRALQEWQQSFQKNNNFRLNKITFWIDLYLYGFPITSQFFMKNIFPKFRQDIIQISIKYEQIFDWYNFFNRKNRYHMRTTIQQWLNQKLSEQKKDFLHLQELKVIIQEKVINQQDNSQISEKYLELFDTYQQKRYKLAYLGFNVTNQPLQLNNIKHQCEFYNKKYQLPPLLKHLYKQYHLEQTHINKKKSNKMQKLLQDQVFLLQIRKCNNITQAINLAGYFLQQLNTELNRQDLVEYIIDYCHSQSNIDLLVKILYQISSGQHSLKAYLTKKGEIISNQIKINKKYINFLTQCTKFGLIKSDILLKYMQRRIQQDNESILNILKELQLIIQSLGPSIYHQSLQTNIRINVILDSLEAITKAKQMNIQILFQLKCLKNYLRLQKKLQSNFQEKDELHSLNVKENFYFLLRKIQQIIQEKEKGNTSKQIQQNQNTKNFQRIVKYFIDAISAQTYMNTYYYASLVKQLKNKKLMSVILEKTVQIIANNIQNNIQTAVCWSRFLGELYNYEIINRKKMIEIFNSLLQKAQIQNNQRGNLELIDFEKMLKCFIECLNISKVYILQSQQNTRLGSLTSQQHVINFLIQLKRILLSYGNLKNYLIQDQFIEILQFFHPVLIKKLTTKQEIIDFQQKMMNLAFRNSFSENGAKTFFVNIYECLSIYGQIEDTINFDSKITNSKKCIISNNIQCIQLKGQKESNNLPINTNYNENNKKVQNKKKIEYKQKPIKKYKQKRQIQVNNTQHQLNQQQKSSLEKQQKQLDIFQRGQQQIFKEKDFKSQTQNYYSQDLNKFNESEHHIDSILVAKQSKQIQKQLQQLQTKGKKYSQQVNAQYLFQQQKLFRGKKSQNNFDYKDQKLKISHMNKNGVRVLIKQNQKPKFKK